MAKSDLVADRPVISLRATPELRDSLLASAHENSRSLSQEVEHRLRASFAGQDQRAVLREVVMEALAAHDAAARERLIGLSAGGGNILTGLIGQNASQPPAQTYDRSAMNRRPRAGSGRAS